MTLPAVHGISDSAYEALREIYGTDRAVFAAAYTHGSMTRHGLRALASKHRIDPDARDESLAGRHDL